jgi:homoserine O-acetyltransferase
MSHDAARGRGSLRRALGSATAEFLIAAVDSDRLYLPGQSQRLRRNCGGGAGAHHCLADRPRRVPDGIGQLDAYLRAGFYPR